VRKLFFFLFVSVFFFVAGFAYGGEEVPQEIIDFAQEVMLAWGQEPVVVEAVKAQNAKNITLEEIQALDERWQNTPGVVDFMQPFLENEVVEKLFKLQEEYPYLVEIFVTDRQGALVAATNKTSDYWQGDEAKFTECYREGEGRLYWGEVEFDESAQTYLVQVSVPVQEEEKTIGVMVIGIDIDAFLAQ